MGLFKKKNPQDAFDPDVFTITDTILDPPRFTFLPAIYQDATRRKWAVHQRGGEPKIFDYAGRVAVRSGRGGRSGGR